VLSHDQIPDRGTATRSSRITVAEKRTHWTMASELGEPSLAGARRRSTVHVAPPSTVRSRLSSRRTKLSCPPPANELVVRTTAHARRSSSADSDITAASIRVLRLAQGMLWAATFIAAYQRLRLFASSA
jgi:hypothetical protein